MTRLPRNAENGTTIIEFALVAFIFFLILWGIFEFGRAFYVRNSTQYLTRCIARAAVVKAPDQAGAVAAKRECLLPKGGSPTELFWPFYDLSANDMTDVFRVRYCGKNEADADCDASKPGNQTTVCENPDNNGCATYVLVDVPNEKLEMLGMLVAWLGAPKEIDEPAARTKMPAESMGFKPPAP